MMKVRARLKAERAARGEPSSSESDGEGGGSSVDEGYDSEAAAKELDAYRQTIIDDASVPPTHVAELLEVRRRTLEAKAQKAERSRARSAARLAAQAHAAAAAALDDGEALDGGGAESMDDEGWTLDELIATDERRQLRELRLVLAAQRVGLALDGAQRRLVLLVHLQRELLEVGEQPVRLRPQLRAVALDPPRHRVELAVDRRRERALAVAEVGEPPVGVAERALHVAEGLERAGGSGGGEGHRCANSPCAQCVRRRAPNSVDSQRKT